LTNKPPDSRPKLPLEPKRLPRGRIVTIAAGFNCEDGVLLCSDSQESYGDFKRHQAKIAIRPAPGFRALGAPLKAVFAGAGDATFVDIVVDKMWDAIKSDVGPIENKITALENRAIELHQKYWPVYTDKEKPDAHLLIALYQKGEKEPRLLKMEGPLVLEVNQYECVGYGVPLAKYLCDRIWECPMSLRPTIIAALYMLEQVKAHVEFCGGHSSLAYIQNDGTLRVMSRVTPGTTEALATIFRVFDETMARLLTTAPNLEISEEQFEERFDKFKKAMLFLRKQLPSLEVFHRVLKDLETKWEYGDGF
jgi:hypothetical protein